MERHYDVTLTGVMPLIMHWDNIPWADKMDAWKNAPANKKGSKAGDDRSPAWRWIGACYNDGERVVIPTDNISRCIMEGGVMVPVPGGKSGKTFKAQTQSGMMPTDSSWPLTIDGKQIDYAPIDALMSEDSFPAHLRVTEKLGFELLVKRAKVGQSKHIRVRPKFNKWSVSGSLVVWDEQITTAALQNIMDYAGQYKGLCDWRPGGKTPGPYGTFTATIAEKS